ncbi:MAG: coenzyme F420-0:L-glutamate ligase [Methanobacteriaceae archaeon]|jgi:coenzyme F420-0:L-glutamate ligase/coenzyme F420-1:gamma-L-glutamate ligase|uniref:coenzyme F420-0:L-glutamate ligase n=1 Tax=Methanobrevibacter TaxID=2172 RepID=UPI002A165252|nr:coenzyme F420-0:L-glutamate ligase [Methanobacteriaceae archaeon]MDD3408797.1 coenzyme F420-0:L-glutamate ligase [Methanobacteriaceae archaeon]MDD4593512.1 coenzyme F420-0:L-glutamate ligase [Methanobacteriaceae archaeon]
MTLELIGLEGIPLVKKGDNITKLILKALEEQNIELEDSDILLIAETMVSKAEGNIINLGDILPSDDAIIIAKKTQKDSKLVEAIIQESREVVAVGPDFIITETKDGFVCANSGIDESNVDEGLATPMPKNADKSARDLREALEDVTGKELAVIITDTQGRAFRVGAIGTAIGCSGINPLWKRKGEKDLYGRELKSSEIATADELAAAASLIQGQADEGLPVVIVRGFTGFNLLRNKDSNINPLLLPKQYDVFRK